MTEFFKIGHHHLQGVSREYIGKANRSYNNDNSLLSFAFFGQCDKLLAIMALEIIIIIITVQLMGDRFKCPFSFCALGCVGPFAFLECSPFVPVQVTFVQLSVQEFDQTTAIVILVKAILYCRGEKIK